MSSNRTPWALSATATWPSFWVSTPATTFSPRSSCGILLLTAFLIRRWSFRVVGREGQDCEGELLETRLLSGHCPSGKPVTAKTAATVDRSTPGHEVNRKQESNHHDGLHIITVVGAALGAHGNGDAGVAGLLTEGQADELGGFTWSWQHLDVTR